MLMRIMKDSCLSPVAALTALICSEQISRLPPFCTFNYFGCIYLLAPRKMMQGATLLQLQVF